MATDLARGNIRGHDLLEITLSPTSVANATTAEQTFTVTGLKLHDFVQVTKPTTQAGLGIVNTRVSATDTLAITFANTTSATITPTASEVYQLVFWRPSNIPVPAAIG